MTLTKQVKAALLKTKYMSLNTVWERTPGDATTAQVSKALSTLHASGEVKRIGKRGKYRYKARYNPPEPKKEFKVSDVNGLAPKNGRDRMAEAKALIKEEAKLAIDQGRYQAALAYVDTLAVLPT